MTEATATTDVMVLAPHPDDAEMSCGGTVLKLIAAGATVTVVDMTRGEMSTRGTAETRRAECEAATATLGLKQRLNLELPDADLRDDDRALAAVVGALRQVRPRLLLAPAPHDLHPDHEATGQVARRAYFHAGLVKVRPELGPPHRPSVVLYYPLHHELRPSLCVDITPFVEAKMKAVHCYATQFDDADRKHLARLDLVQRAEARNLFYGAQIGCLAAEPFASEGPLNVAALDLLA